MSGVFTIPPDLCFVSTLAEGLWRRVEGDPLALSSYAIYLPTRRACRALREAFLRATGARAALLPRLQPLGDVDETELDFFDPAVLAEAPPAISPLRRQMLLTQLVLKKDSSLPMDQAASMADALGKLLDQMQSEEKDFAAFEALVPDLYAQHWQETLLFLEIVTREWPHVLKKEGCVDPALRRRMVLDAQAQTWREKPPAHPVIAAGSTGSIPAVGRLMAAIAELPCGEVVLPGLDVSLDEVAWQEIDDTHPQATMKAWLDSVKKRRAEVKFWEGREGARPARARLLSETMRPAKVTESWRDLTAREIPPEAVQGLSYLELEHHREEADVIALRLRAALEEPERTAALITPDRALAARVAASLRRWGIEADDSAGTPLPAWPAGSFLGDLLAAAAPEASPVDYLALLKHPLAAAGVDPPECRRRARKIETKIWRGVRLAGGWRGAAQALAQEEAALAAWLEEIAEAFAPLTENWREKKTFDDHLAAHIALAEKLAEAPRLWSGEAGEAAGEWLADLKSAAAGFPLLTGADYARLFPALMAAISVRPAYGSHPRLSILGPLEARLLHHDVTLLGGLNEGVWPPAPPVDPWLSRPMKTALGLPSPERRIGLAAHDFVCAACAGDVLITRARRVGAVPSVPSRFVLQLETVLKAVLLEASLAPERPWRVWARSLDRPEKDAPMPPPAPCPPLAARPTKLSVTEIGTWMRNPYAIYAKHILNLKKLDEIDADVSAAEHGTVLHEALEKFLAQTLENWPEEALALLLEEGRRAFAPYADRPQVKAFWWPRFERIAAWFTQNEESRRAEGVAPLAVEAKGNMAFCGGAFTLSGRADRLDRLEDGRLAIIDYKTGAVPKKKDVMAGYEPQLALLALMAEAGRMKDVAPAQVAEVAYWRMQGGKEPVAMDLYAEELEAQQVKARNGLENLVKAFSDPATPYEVSPKPALAPRYDDYKHLARLEEWGRLAENGNEEEP